MVFGFLKRFSDPWVQNGEMEGGTTPYTQDPAVLQGMICRPSTKKGLVLTMENRSAFHQKYQLKKSVVFGVGGRSIAPAAGLPLVQNSQGLRG